jgi:hypothetical protein
MLNLDELLGEKRSIRWNGRDYPVEEIKEEQYDNPKIFVALWAILALGASVIVYIVIQFRHEIVKFFSYRILRRRR